jgi:molybdenum cofactor cytidylyltransferase
MPDFGAIILAAGASSRMGAVKQLLELDGSTLLARAVDEVLRSGARPVVVVLGANAQKIRPCLSGLDVQVAENPRWRDGLSSSIRVGMAAVLEAAPATAAVLVTPCDQPALSSEIVARLAAAHRASGKISCARFEGRNASPAIFGRQYFQELGSLEGDKGARDLLNADPGRVEALEIPSLAQDLDTMVDYMRWKR